MPAIINLFTNSPITIIPYNIHRPPALVRDFELVAFILGIVIAAIFPVFAWFEVAGQFGVAYVFELRFGLVVVTPVRASVETCEGGGCTEGG